MDPGLHCNYGLLTLSGAEATSLIIYSRLNKRMCGRVGIAFYIIAKYSLIFRAQCCYFRSHLGEENFGVLPLLLGFPRQLLRTIAFSCQLLILGDDFFNFLPRIF